MSLRRITVLIWRDLGRGPRSSTFLYALFMPVLIALVTKVILFTLFDPKPRLAISDSGHSQISENFEKMTSIELTRAHSAAELRRLVENNDVDAGLNLISNFDSAVRHGQRPKLELFLSGESRMTQRIILAITTIDQVRQLENRPTPVKVMTRVVGGDSVLPLEDLIVLGILFWPLLVCSTLVPGMLLVQEREQRTLDAMLVTPTRITEIMLSKAGLGFVMAMVMCLITLVICDAMPAHPLTFLLTLSISVLICCQIGLIYGSAARNSKALYSIAQTFNMLILAPLLFYFFPSWPQWIARLIPTWWFIDALYRVTMQGDTLTEIGGNLLVCLIIVVVLLIPVILFGRRMQCRQVGAL